MRLLVTGGAGFIGSNYVRRILDGSLCGVDSLTVLDKLTYAGSMSNFAGIESNDFEFIKGDICDHSIVSKLVSRNDAIVNFAAESHVDRSISDPRDFIVTNVLGTNTLLNAARQKEGFVFVQISTDEVYGSITFGSAREDSQLQPNSPYSSSKASADLLARSYFRTYGTDVRITRCTNNYGPNQFPEKFIPLLITNLLDDESVPIYGDGANIRDWLHVDDHCRAIHLVLEKGSSGNVYNIGGGTEISNIDLAKKVLKLMGKAESSIEFIADRLGHDFRYSVNYNKITSELGYTPVVRFEDGIMDTVNWYMENRSWWKPLKIL